MTDNIFIIHDNGKLTEMNEQEYDSEALLQSLLANYPKLLPGGQIDVASPRKWLLVKREMGIPSEEDGGERWSVDHLFLDQDAIPTVVEVKRSNDTRIRREVVGQMLEYAANGVVYWPVEQIKAEFEQNSDDPEEQLLDFLGEDGNSDDFWQRVKTNLQAGKIRLLFVADEIPPELRRIVEFMNEQMDPAEVLAVEIKQYVGDGMKTLVPQVFGQTEQARQKKAVSSYRYDDVPEDEFLARYSESRNSPDEDRVVRSFVDSVGQECWAENWLFQREENGVLHPHSRSCWQQVLPYFGQDSGKRHSSDAAPQELFTFQRSCQARRTLSDD
jgi:hypothetical protein